MNHLNCNMFSKLEQSFSGAVKKLQQGIYKLYLVTAYNNNKNDKVTEFFQKMSSELQGVSEWKDWFCKCRTLLKSSFLKFAFFQSFRSAKTLRSIPRSVYTLQNNIKILF